MAPSDEIDLLRRIATGDANALASFYDHFGRLVYSIAIQVLTDQNLAEEVTQDVFLQVWNKATTFDPSQGKLVTWLASITRHRAIDHYRRLRIRPEGSSIAWDDCCEDSSDDSLEIESSFLGTEKRRLLLTALSNLPADQRHAIALAYFRGLTQQEIAAHLNEPLGTVKTRIRLGLQKLRGLLDAAA